MAVRTPAALVIRKSPTAESVPLVVKEITGRTRIITKDDLEKSATEARAKIRAKTSPEGIAVGAAQLAASQTEILRMEVREDVGRIHERLDNVDERVGDLREGFGRLEGKVDTMATSMVSLVDVLKQREQVQTLKMTTEIDVGRQQATAQIENTTKTRQWWRDTGSKVVAGILAALAAVAAYFSGKGN